METQGVAAGSDAPRCIGCGYCLNGLGPAGDCPECGLSVARSIRQDNAWANRRWLRSFSLASGGLIAAIGLLVFSILLSHSAYDRLVRLSELCRPIALVVSGLFGAVLARHIPWPMAVRNVKIGRRLLCGSAAIVPLSIAVQYTSSAARATLPDLVQLHLMVEFSLVFLYLAMVSDRLYERPLMLACGAMIALIVFAIGLPTLLSWGFPHEQVLSDARVLYQIFILVPCAVIAIGVLAQQMLTARDALAQ